MLPKTPKPHGINNYQSAMNTIAAPEVQTGPENRFFYLSSIQKATANLCSISGNFLFTKNSNMMTDKEEE